MLAGKHLLVEKPSVLSLAELDELDRIAREKQVLAKVVYHKLLDPDHKKLRTLVVDEELKHINNGYCSLLEPKSISGGQFAEWIKGRNPGTYVAVHYIKLIDFTFGGRLKSVTCTGQRGLVGPADGPTWDSTQLRLIYEYADQREAAFDIHTSWVTPDNFPGYVEQEVQFRFDNGVWNGHSRKRGVECTIEGSTPLKRKTTINNHYNGSFVEPWGERSQRGYGVEVIERFVRELAFVEARRAERQTRRAAGGNEKAGLQRYRGRSSDGCRSAGHGGHSCRARSGAAELCRGSGSSRRRFGAICSGLKRTDRALRRPRECLERINPNHIWITTMTAVTEPTVSPIAHPGEEQSNDFRRRLQAVEPLCLRTYTPSLAVIARSEGCYHYTPEGRKLADFTSGVLVANLGHNPARWWKRVLEFMQLGTSASGRYQWQSR